MYSMAEFITYCYTWLLRGYVWEDQRGPKMLWYNVYSKFVWWNYLWIYQSCQRHSWLLQAKVVAPPIQPSNQLNTLPSKRNATLGLGASLTPIWGQRPHGVNKLLTGVRESPSASHIWGLELEVQEQEQDHEMCTNLKRPPLREGPKNWVREHAWNVVKFIKLAEKLCSKEITFDYLWLTAMLTVCNRLQIQV